MDITRQQLKFVFNSTCALLPVTMTGISGFIALCLATFHAESVIASPQHHFERDYSVTPTVNLGYEIHQGVVNVSLLSSRYLSLSWDHARQYLTMRHRQ